MLNQLKNLGLTENEAKVYLAMLELGPAAVLEISAKAGVNRPTAYVQIESLKKMGLVSTQSKGNKTLFVAESPSQLEFILDKEQKLLESRKQELASVLPDLTSMFNLSDSKPIVRYFEGKEGLVKMQDEFLKKKPNEIVGITSFDDVLKVFPRQFESYTPERVKRKIHSRVIYTSSEGPFLAESDQKMLRQSKYVKPGDLPFNADITIFGDAVAIAALKGKLYGAIIEHQEIANSFKGLFEFAWKLIK